MKCIRMASYAAIGLAACVHAGYGQTVTTGTITGLVQESAGRDSAWRDGHGGPRADRHHLRGDERAEWPLHTPERPRRRPVPAHRGLVRLPQRRHRRRERPARRGDRCSGQDAARDGHRDRGRDRRRLAHLYRREVGNDRLRRRGSHRDAADDQSKHPGHRTEFAVLQSDCDGQFPLRALRRWQ